MKICYLVYESRTVLTTIKVKHKFEPLVNIVRACGIFDQLAAGVNELVIVFYLVNTAQVSIWNENNLMWIVICCLVASQFHYSSLKFDTFCYPDIVVNQQAFFSFQFSRANLLFLHSIYLNGSFTKFIKFYDFIKVY